MAQEQKQPIHLLWTGGWDSTFRLLHLVLSERRTVQPYYVMDSDRQSTGVEIRVMRNIKSRLFSRDPEARDLLLPTYFKELFDIAPNPSITERFERIRSRLYMGRQYEWLPRFCAEVGISEMELCIHKDDKAHKILETFCTTSDDGNGVRYKVEPRWDGSDEYALFRCFRFPVFELRKVDMQTLAKKAGFHDLMELTWFCHSPRPNFQPCGICNPCIYTMEEGLGRRLPFSSRMRSRFHVILRAKHFVQKRPELYVFSKRLKRSLGL